MRFSSRLSAVLGLSLFSTGGFAACSKDTVSCGEGTELSGDTCVVGGGGEGGMGGSEPVSDPDPVIVDRDGRSADQILVEEQFSGAIAYGPISDSSVLVVWKPLAVEGLSYNVYVAKKAQDLSFGRPQYTAPEGADSWEVSGLDEDKTYFVAVVPVLDGVELPVGHTPIEVVAENDNKVPSFAGVESAKPADGAQVRLSWAAAKDNKSPKEVIRYLVYVGETRNFAQDPDAYELRVPFAVSAPGATSIVVAGLPKPETQYFFVVRARDAAGNIDDNFATKDSESGPDTAPPRFAGCNFAAQESASALQLSWEPASDDTASPDEIIYNFYASKKPDGHNFSKPTASVVGGNRGSVTGLDRSSTYYVICRAEDPSGNEEENSRPVSADTADDGEPPTFDGITTTTNLGTRSVDLVWEPATDDQTPSDEIIYDVYVRRESESPQYDSAFAQTTGSGGISLVDLDSNTKYFASVITQDLAGVRSEPSEEEPFTTLVSFSADIESGIFEGKCTYCHLGVTPPAGLNLESDQGSGQGSYNALVNVMSESSDGILSGFPRIKPGLPDESHLVQRIESTESGFAMPNDGSDFLSVAEIATIRDWITQGANEN
jgi:hypothetical protein